MPSCASTTRSNRAPRRCPRRDRRSGRAAAGARRDAHAAAGLHAVRRHDGAGAGTDRAQGVAVPDLTLTPKQLICIHSKADERFFGGAQGRRQVAGVPGRTSRTRRSFDEPPRSIIGHTGPGTLPDHRVLPPGRGVSDASRGAASLGSQGRRSGLPRWGPLPCGVPGSRTLNGSGSLPGGWDSQRGRRAWLTSRWCCW